MHFNTSKFKSEQEYREHLSQFDEWNKRLFMAAVSVLGWPGHYLDVGCGTGAMVGVSRQLGMAGYGIDLMVEPKTSEPWMIKQDLTTPFDLGRKFSLITCIEVAEHIPKKKVKTFTDVIDHHLVRGGLFIFTAASPGQGGEDHTFLRPGYWWRDWFANYYGISYREDYTLRLKMLWQMIPHPMRWIPANVQVFDR